MWGAHATVRTISGVGLHLSAYLRQGVLMFATLHTRLARLWDPRDSSLSTSYPHIRPLARRVCCCLAVCVSWGSELRSHICRASALPTGHFPSHPYQAFHVCLQNWLHFLFYSFSYYLKNWYILVICFPLVRLLPDPTHLLTYPTLRTFSLLKQSLNLNQLTALTPKINHTHNKCGVWFALVNNSTA